MTKVTVQNALKFWCSVLILIGAALVLMPGLISYLMGLSRIIVIIVVTLFFASIAGNILFRLKRGPVQSIQSSKSSTSLQSDQSDQSESATRETESTDINKAD